MATSEHFYIVQIELLLLCLFYFYSLSLYIYILSCLSVCLSSVCLLSVCLSISLSLYIYIGEPKSTGSRWGTFVLCAHLSPLSQCTDAAT